MNGMTDIVHLPVLLAEVCEWARLNDGDLVVDGTFGAGGYTTAFLEKADCQVIAFDRDPEAIMRGERLAQRYDGRLSLVEGCFGDMERHLHERGIDKVDAVVLDIGVSSPQIDTATRGFSFRQDGPLDMRMSQDGRSAADLVNELDEAELADIIYLYGEERHSRRVARAIVAARAEAPLTRTLELADLVRRAVPQSRDGIDPATRTFQALRIAVNDELGELKRALAAAERLLKPEGRLVVVTFHSLEDRIVKTFLAERSGRKARGSRYLPEVETAREPSFTLLNRKPVTAGDAECARNPRARSAKLRAAVRTTAPFWPESEKEAA